jgi:hypothetical protein
MPKISKESAPNVQEYGPRSTSAANLMTTRSTSSPSGRRIPGGLLKGLPRDSCPCPHWGYLFTGKITVTYADREETYHTRDAFYMAPGHVPAADTGSEFVQFSPARRWPKSGPS